MSNEITKPAPMNLSEFAATARDCDDELWGEISEYFPSQESCIVFANAYVIHKEDDKFFVHAWWVSPQPYSTLDEATAKLYDWYIELY